MASPFDDRGLSRRKVGGTIRLFRICVVTSNLLWSAVGASVDSQLGQEIRIEDSLAEEAHARGSRVVRRESSKLISVQSGPDELSRQATLSQSRSESTGDVGMRFNNVLGGPDGELLLRNFNQSKKHLCDVASGPGDDIAAAEFFSMPTDVECDSGLALSETGAGRSVSMAVLRKVFLSYDEVRQQPELTMQCRESQGAGSVARDIGTFALGGATLQASKTNIPTEVCFNVPEDTILVINPHKKYFANLHTSLEEIFSIFETLDVLGKRMADFRVLFAYGKQLLQLDGQLDTDRRREVEYFESTESDDGLDEEDALPTDVVPQLAELWSTLVAHKSEEKMLRLPHSIPDTGFCFQGQVVLPMRACPGEAHKWSDLADVGTKNALALQYSNRILSAFNIDSGRRSRSAHQLGPSVVFLWRHHASDRNVIGEDKDELATRLQTAHGGLVDIVDFTNFTFSQQIHYAHMADLLVSTHGAGMSHVIFGKPGAGVIEISEWPVPFKNSSVGNTYRNLALWTNKRYRHVLGHHVTVGGQHTMKFNVDAVLHAAQELLVPDAWGLSTSGD